jgi:hypothetical protein
MQSGYAPRLNTNLRSRMPSCFMRSSNRRAQTNSAASNPSPSRTTSHPGAGLAINIAPSASSVNPIRIRRKRFACCRVLKTSGGISTTVQSIRRLQTACCIGTLFDARALAMIQSTRIAKRHRLLSGREPADEQTLCCVAHVSEAAKHAKNGKKLPSCVKNQDRD